MRKNQYQLYRKYKNRIYYLLNKQKITKNYNRIHACRYRNRPFIGNIKIEYGEFLISFN
jgi:hypothetical protein